MLLCIDIISCLAQFERHSQGIIDRARGDILRGPMTLYHGADVPAARADSTCHGELSVITA